MPRKKKLLLKNTVGKYVYTIKDVPLNNWCTVAVTV
jgi:hypothetical protein